MVRLQNDMDNNYETLRVESLGNYDAHIGFHTNGTSDYWWGIGIDYSDSGKFKISGDNILSVNPRLTIDTSGNVGIGTTSPSEKLQVVGGSSIINVKSTTAGANSNIHFETTARRWGVGANMALGSSDFETYDYTAGSNRFVLNSNGNVGIGVANPQSEKLEVAGNIKANDVNGKFYTNAYSFANADTYADTVSVSGHCLYEYIIEVNPNSAGSGLYADYYYGKVGIGVGWNGSTVTQYIFQNADETAPRSLYPSGGGNISITARMIYSFGVYTELAAGTTCTIRFQGFSTAQYGIVYLRRLA
jgi:hypothetical protein